MRGSVLGSALVHVGIVVALFLVRAPAPVIVPGPEVVQVALLDALPVAPKPLPVPPREPEPIPDVAATEEEGVRIEKPKPPKKPPPKQETRAPEPSAPAPALPFAAVGPPGLRGEVSVDASDFEFTYYLMLVRNRIAQNWTPPAGGAQGAQSVIYFKIARDGSIVAPRVEQGSGVEFFDRGALRAVVLSDPLPPLPLGWSGSELGVHFGFEYTGP